MERTNHLSDNLKAYKEGMGKSLSDFARELSIPKSTIQAAMADGNTTLDTLIRIANALGVSLDELVFGTVSIEAAGKARCLLRQVEWYHFLPADKQEAFQYHFGEILKLM